MVRKALLVGINDYAPVGAGGPDLRGCVNDVRDMANTLNALGIVPATPGTMHILTDVRATRANILNELRWLIQGAKRGDILVFHYSGHGSQVVDTSGDEPDRKDETICPHDFATAGMIKDDDLRAVLAGVATGVNLDVLLDSCHSGTGTRELALLNAAPDEEMVTYRYIEPPLDYGYFLEVYPNLPTQGLLRPAPAAEGESLARQTVVVPGLNHVLWGGCRNNQTSAEASIGGTVRGIFTYCFCRMLRTAGVNVTRRRLDSLVSAEVRRLGYSQVPQLEGTATSLKEKVFT